MPIQQPPFNKDQAKSVWEYELTAFLNTLEDRSLPVLGAVDSYSDADKLALLLAIADSILERNNAAQLYIQDEQPDPVYANGFMWLQTNVNSDGDYSLWFCEGD